MKNRPSSIFVISRFPKFGTFLQAPSGFSGEGQNLKKKVFPIEDKDEAAHLA